MATPEDSRNRIDLAEQLKAIEKELTQAQQARFKLSKEINEAIEKGHEVNKEDIKTLRELSTIIRTFRNDYTDVEKKIISIDKTLTQSKKRTQDLGKNLSRAFSSFFELSGQAPSGRRVARFFENSADKSKKFAANAKGFSKFLGVAAGHAHVLGAAMTPFYAAALKASDSFTTLARNLDVSQGTAQELAFDFKRSSDFGNLLGNTIKDFVVDASAAREVFGVNTKNLIEQARYTAILRKNLGLTAEEGATLAFVSEATGASIDDFVLGTKSLVDNFSLLEKAGVNIRTVIKDINKLSKDTLRNFIGQGTALLDAVIQTKALGINLDQANKISKSLLNIEQSLKAENEARVLTGLQLNFDQARYFANMKKIDEAAASVLKQLGGWEKFSSLTNIQQESIAASIGLSAGQLGEVVTKQKVIEELGGGSVERGKEQLAQLRALNAVELQRRLNVEATISEEAKSFLLTQQKVSVQDQFNDLVTRLQDVIVAAAPIIIKFLNMALSTITGVVNIMESSPLLSGLFDIGIGAAGGALAGLAVGNPLGGALLGGAGALGLVAASSPQAVGFAEGGVFTQPTTLQTPSGFVSFAERGPEAVVPLENYSVINKDQNNLENLLKANNRLLSSLVQVSGGNKEVTIQLGSEIVKKAGMLINNENTWDKGLGII